MGFNPKKELIKIKESLNEKGYKKDIPVDVFGVEIMRILGCHKPKAVKWINNFEIFGMIKRNEDKINFL